MRFVTFSMQRLRSFRLLLPLLLLAGPLHAQTVIQGTVRDATDNSPLPGVNISEVSTSNGASSDQDGNFSLTVNSLQSTVRFSFLGYRSQDSPLNGRTHLTVALQIANEELDKIVVIGYGTQKKVNLTGSVQTLRLDSVVNTPVTNSAQLMYGRFSGVQLTQGGGLPGSDGSSINIRGLGTFGNSAPLVVIDGMQFDGKIGRASCREQVCQYV